MLVGDFIDAITGYNEAENKRVKSIAELIRRSTTILWNIHVPVEERLMACDLWQFPWDKQVKIKGEVISDEEKQRRQDQQDEYLLKNFSQ